MLSIGELASRSGVTVRALRYYESKGLMKPLRSEAGQRVYKYPDIVRLQQVQLLKRAGFTLSQIAAMIGNAEIEAKNVLRIQQKMLQQQLKQTQSALDAINNAIERLDDTATDLFTLCNTIKVGESAMSDEGWKKVWNKFYTDDEQDRWEKARLAVPEHIQRECEKKWPDLLSRTEALVGTDPTAPAALALVKEWDAVTQPIYDIDPCLKNSAGRLYDNMDDWPEGAPEAPFSKEVWAFIRAAERAIEENTTKK
ncbi:MAG: MerR family transcriptional regulator [Kordiimonadaceae bacterium]|nr:MerR family transcriptional regulator [Kordiimonadaceae bacterium]